MLCLKYGGGRDWSGGFNELVERWRNVGIVVYFYELWDVLY